MAVKYKELEPGVYAESDALKNAKTNADLWGEQKLQDFTYNDFAASDRTNQYQSNLDSLKAPGDFTFAHQQGWDNIIDKINNREPFTYDVNGDALYQQYKNQFITGGKMAMMDTMGQAAAMTGGYGNSYAQNVGQQAYQGYLQQLNDKVPELYQLAMSKYQMEGDDLYKQHGMYTDLFNRDYGMHRDTVADYQADRSYLADMWSKSHAADFDTYTANRDTYTREVESHNKNITDSRDYAWKVYNDLRNTEWGQYMDNETLKQLAVEVANDNIYKAEQTRIADSELAEKIRANQVTEKLAQDRLALDKDELALKKSDSEWQKSNAANELALQRDKLNWDKTQSSLAAENESLKNQYVVDNKAIDKVTSKILSKEDFKDAAGGRDIVFGKKTNKLGFARPTITSGYTIDGKTYKNYSEYVKATLEAAYKNGDITTEATLNALLDKYGL